MPRPPRCRSEKDASTTSANDAATGGLQRFDQCLNGRFFGCHRCQRLQRLLNGQALTVNDLVGTPQHVECGGGKAPAAQPFEIDAVGARTVAARHHVGRNILQHHRTGAAHDMGTDMAELMYCRKTAQNGMITHMHMPGQRRIVGQDHMVTDDTVMCHVRIGHQQIVTADSGNAGILYRTAMDGDTLTDDVVVTDLQKGWLALELFVLTVFTHSGELKNPVTGPDTGRPLDHDMGFDAGTRPDLHVRADQGPGPHFNIIGQAGRRVDNGLRVNQCHTFLSAQRMVALLTVSPSTLARTSNFQIPRRSEITLASSCSWTPGTTGRLKRRSSAPTK